MIDRKDIDKLVAGKTYTTNPEWPDRESSGWKWKKYADGSCELWYQVTIARTTSYKFTSVTLPFELADADWQHTIGIVGAAFTSCQITNSSSGDSRTTTGFTIGSIAGAATLSGIVTVHITGRWE